MSGIELIAEERERQVVVEGWAHEHDDGHLSAELTNAACAYSERAAEQLYSPDFAVDGPTPECWPWDGEWWKPSSDPIRNLVKAGALIAAEIDRIQRRKSRMQEPHKG